MQTIAFIRIPTFVFLILLSLTGFDNLNAQPKFTTSDVQLANEYYRNKEYAKAAVIYKQLYEQETQVRSYYMFYLNCLLELQEHDEAEKLIKKAMKTDKNDLGLLVDLGYTYKRMGKLEKADKTYEEALNKLDGNRNTIINLASRFNSKREYDYAVKAYLIGRKLLNNQHLFRNELGNAYMMQRSYDLMIKEYISWVDEGVENVNFVKNRLQSILRIDVQDNIYLMVRDALIIELQNNPNSVSLSELIVWLYTQKKEFKSAFTIAKSIDRRLNEDGGRLFQLGKMASENEEMETAVEIFEHIIKLEKRSPYYFESKSSLLRISYQLLKDGQRSAFSNPAILAAKFTESLHEFGRQEKTAPIMIDYASLQAFYLNEPDNGLNLLNEVLSIRGLSPEIFAKAKLELADINLYSRDIWEAAILYGQVEKENANNPLGHEAKLRKAKLAYYTGDFKWAQAQLNILKASTSKLISNDAIDLANLISQNTQLDNEGDDALKIFAEGNLYQFKNQWVKAIRIYDSLMTVYPSHSLVDESLYELAMIHKSLGHYEKSIEFLEKIIKFHDKDILADDAIYEMGLLYEEFINDELKAMDVFEQLILNYKSSIYVMDSRMRYRALREKHGISNPKFINEEIN